MNDSTIIVGGGLAGLAAAAALVERGVSVRLLESRSCLGGRARSFRDAATGYRVDNCQHVTMGCCTNLAYFCRRVGIEDRFRRERTLHFVSPQGKVSRFSAVPLATPGHLLPAFCRLAHLSQQDRRQIARGLWSLTHSDVSHEANQSFEAWLRQNGQTDTTIDRFWGVVLVSALSETLDRISIAHARKVLADAFLANSKGWELWIPKVPLDDLYGDHLLRWLQRQGGAVSLKTPVRRVVIDGDRATCLELRNGRRLEADQFVLAVPHRAVNGLLPESLLASPQLCGIRRLQSAPIAAVHLWFDRPITSLPHAVLVGRQSQWFFNGSAIGRFCPEVAGPLFYCQVVISAARTVYEQKHKATITLVLNELAQVWPRLRQAQLVHSRVIIERDAVFSPTPEADRCRPVQQTPIANLQLAGDWTQTGWPSTMEGAVRSGYLAAENVLQHMGRPAKLLRPDLPIGFLSKLLWGL